jgi:glycogen(starch) synthase
MLVFRCCSTGDLFLPFLFELNSLRIPWVILEGMLHGVPIVASAIGGPAEILEYERTGLLFPPRDVEALACALLQFVENPAQRRDIGTAAVEEVHREWLWPRIVEKMRRVYQEMM